MRPNFVLLTVDSLRADHSTKASELMPRINEYTDDGVRFTRAYANGYATPISFPTILTGTYADHYGGSGYMSDERPFLASKFQDSGYATAGFHTNPHLRDDKNYDIGFNTYNDFDDEAGGLSRLRYLVTQNLDSDSVLYKLLKRVYHFVRTTSGSSDYTEAPALNEKALRWIDQERDKDSPFFLWTHYMDVHYPFYPPDEFLDDVTDRSISKNRAISVNGKMHEDGTELSDEDIADLQALYRGDVRYLDHHLGEFIDALKQRGLLEDTVFIVTSDHGELFGEHGKVGHPPSGYEESFHVPLFCFGPGIPEGRRIEDIASLLDIPPTVAGLFDLGEDSRWEGKSLVPSIKDGPRDQEHSMFLGDTSVLAYQNERWRLVWWRDIDNPENPDQEWDLWQLPECKRVPVDSQKDIVNDFREEMHSFLDRAAKRDKLAEPAVGEETEDRLEALGYK
ncbi:sulfatase [Halobellus limi]|nr:sulfatase [Halobellus limi]